MRRSTRLEMKKMYLCNDMRKANVFWQKLRVRVCLLSVNMPVTMWIRPGSCIACRFQTKYALLGMRLYQKISHRFDAPSLFISTQGFVPGLFGTSHGAVQFTTYEELKKLYCNYHSVPITTQLASCIYVHDAS